MTKTLTLDKERDTRVLRNTLALLEKGWTQDSWATGEDGKSNLDHVRGEGCKCYCLIGALDRACYQEVGPFLTVGIGAWTNLSQLIEAAYISKAITKKSGSIRNAIAWNDERGRTQEEVLDVVKLAIELSEVK